jgi:hypothetical protein
VQQVESHLLIPFVIESSRGKGIAKNISEISVACFEWMAILLVPFGKKRGALKEEAKILQKIALTDELSRLLLHALVIDIRAPLLAELFL